jgi:hypothetical protein
LALTTSMKLSAWKLTGRSVTKEVGNDELQRLLKIGVTDFKTFETAKGCQLDVIERLATNPWFRGACRHLQRCTARECGGTDCKEVCAFGDRRRQLSLIPEAHRLLSKVPRPLHELRVVRGVWARPIGGLWDVSIPAMGKLNRRALDSLYKPSIVAVGTVKVAVAPRYKQPHWVGEIHQIVAGAEKQELEDAFVSKWAKENYHSVVHWKEVEHLGQTLARVFDTTLAEWQDPHCPYDELEKPTKSQRQEFYRWLLGLNPGERLVRYGCDRYLNPLKKQPRIIHIKTPKKRPHPVWLTEHMFGNRGQPGEYPDGYRNSRRRPGFF